MDLPLPEDVRLQLESFEELLGSLESRLKPFMGTGNRAKIAQLDPLERAQTHLALAHTIHTLFQLYLKASGVDPADHESSKEEERLKQYGKKVRKAMAEKELKESRRSLEVNVAAVNRFISAAVPDLSREQRAALKGGAQKQAAASAAASAAAAAAGDVGRKRKSGGNATGGDDGEDASDAAAAFLQQTMAELGGAGGEEGAQQQPAATAAAAAAAATSSLPAGAAASGGGGGTSGPNQQQSKKQRSKQ